MSISVGCFLLICLFGAVFTGGGNRFGEVTRVEVTRVRAQCAHAPRSSLYKRSQRACRIIWMCALS